MSENPPQVTERLDDLEVMTAHQSMTIEELSQELRSAFDRIARLEAALRSMTERMLTLEETALPRPEVTKPPHY